MAEAAAAQTTDSGAYVGATLIDPTSLPPYPPAMLAAGRSGQVTVSCTVGINGKAFACDARGRGGAPFDQAVLSWVAQQRFTPMTHAGHPVQQPNYLLAFNFVPPSVQRDHNTTVNALPIGMPSFTLNAISPKDPGADLTVVCGINTSGVVHDCHVTALIGDARYAEGAVRISESKPYMPAMHDNAPVEEPSHVFRYKFRFK